jgi:ketopantoate reductase
MTKPFVILGVGEMGAVFARGFLRAGYPVYPVTRQQDPSAVAASVPEPHLTLVAVGEGDLHPVMETIPSAWRDRLALLQNELLPPDWLAHGLTEPTVISAWFEKKKGQDVKVVLPSPVYGPGADWLISALAQVDIPTHQVTTPEQLQYELVRKNLYILVSNIAGLITGGTVNELWRDHRDLARRVAEDVLTLQSHRLGGVALDAEVLLAGMVEAFEGDPEHKCTGRSAPKRLARVLAQARAADLEVPTLEEIAERTGAA